MIGCVVSLSKKPWPDFMAFLFKHFALGPAVQIFSEKRGQWKAATQSQEFIRTLQRYYNNTYLDGDKQKAINL